MPFVSPRRGGDVNTRTLAAYREWSAWYCNHDAAARLGPEPPAVQGDGEMCKAYFDASVYTRRGAKDRYMAGIMLCRRCHCPHQLVLAPPPKEAEREDERELEYVHAVPEKIHQKEPSDAEK